MLKHCSLRSGWRVTPLLLLALLIGVLAGGCSDAAKQASQPAEPQLDRQVLLPANAPAGANAGQVAPSTPAAGQSVGLRPLPPPAAPQQPTLNIPMGARWTVFCFSVEGAGHVLGANQARDSLNIKSGRSDWYVIHGQDTSNLYFGFYQAVGPSDGKDSHRAQQDLQWVRQIKDAKGDYPFARSLFVALDAPDPTAPPEWDLFNVDRTMNPHDPKRAFWSLQIMAFRAHPLRKQAAVQAVADLRAKGVEAYYYHGEVTSSVTVGKWRYDAVKEQHRTDDARASAITDPGTPLVVMNVEQKKEEEARRIDGKRAVSVAPKLEIQEPTMLKMISNFPTHAVNYEIGVTAGVREGTTEKVAIEDPSFLVEIPRASGNGLFDSGGPAPVVQGGDSDWGRQRGPSMIGSTPPHSVGRQ